MRKITPARLLLWSVVLLVVGFWSLVGIALAWDGWVGIRVDSIADSPRSVHLVFPAALVDVACHAMVFADVRDFSIGPQTARLLPMVSSLTAALAEAPDAALVVVRQGEQRVTVEKRHGKFRVRVATPEGQRVDVSVPTRAVRHILTTISRLANLH